MPWARETTGATPGGAAPAEEDVHCGTLHGDDKGKPGGQSRVRPASVHSPRRARVSDARFSPRCSGSASAWVVDPSCQVDYGNLNLCNGAPFKLCDDHDQGTAASSGSGEGDFER